MSLPAPLRLAVADNSAAVRGIFSALPASEAVVRAQARTRQDLERVVRDTPLDAVVCADDLAGHLVGADTIRRLRDHNLVAPNTALVMLVQNSRKDHIMACLQAKPDTIILKPFSLENLSRRLLRAVERRRQLGELTRLQDMKQWEALLAEARFRQTDIGGGHVTAAQHEATALLEMGRGLEADAVLERVLAQTPGLLWAEESLAKRELQRGDVFSGELRLIRLVADHPGHVAAHEMLSELKLGKGDMSGAQEHLEQVVRRAGTLDQKRQLGLLAILNQSYQVATSTLFSAVRETHNINPFGDQINLLRAHMLGGDTVGLIHANSVYKATGHRDMLMYVVDYFTGAVRARSSGHLGQAQDLVFQGLRALDGCPDDAIPLELRLFAVDACLMAVLTHQASERSRALLMDAARPLPKLHAQWLLKVHDWARNPPEDSELPRGLRGYKRLLP